MRAALNGVLGADGGGFRLESKDGVGLPLLSFHILHHIKATLQIRIKLQKLLSA